MLRMFVIAAALVGNTANGGPKVNPFDRLDKGDLIVTNPRGNLLYKREYPTMAACLHAKAAIDAQQPLKVNNPYVVGSTERGPSAICVPH